MAFSTGVIRAVNPVSLAHASSVTKIPRFAAPVTPVIRPNLLTTQLMGCCPNCAGGDHAGPVGLTGFIPPDYGSLRDGGSYGLFKMASSGHGLGKGASGTNAATYGTRSYSFGLRGLGKGASGTNAASYDTRSWAFGLRGLGQALTSSVPSAGSGNTSVYDTIINGGSNLPGVGNVSPETQSQINQAENAAKAWIGSGRQEADLIVPQQNNFIAALGTITNQFLTGSSPSLATLQSAYTQVWIRAVAFQEFVLKSIFKDRRASGQALNTVMPYVDGSCGYAVPIGTTATPGQQNCMSWGDGTLGGAGTNGILGALSRAITGAGGSPPVLMDLHQAANQGLPASTAAAVNPVTGQAQSVMGLPSTIAGINTTTLLLIGLGVLLISRMR